MAQQQQKVLCVGLVCLDIINVVSQFPEEDSDTRCVSQRWQRGGNASNSCTVLTLLGQSASFMGSLSAGPAADFILEDFQRYGVDVSMVTEHAQCDSPSSVVISNITNGSRTILHMNSFIMADFERAAVDVSAVVWQDDAHTPCACCLVCPSSGSRTVVLSDTNLPDVTAEDFSKVDLHPFRWIHLEGRNPEEQLKMIQLVEQFNSHRPMESRIVVSVEIEKTRETLYQLFPHADVVFVSKDVARHHGYQSAAAAVEGLYSRVKEGAVLICAWGEEGADAVGPDGVLVHSDAFPPERVVDTLGAGDTFNAAVIYSLLHGESLQDAVSFGCMVAGWKCGFHGYEGISDKLKEFLKKQ